MAEQFGYLTVAARTESFYKEKGSKFIGYAFPIRSEEHFKEELESIKREHHQARHHCYGFVLGDKGEQYRGNDDGEPNGTAGRPILAPIQGRNLTYTAVVVVRYFGGTKLGKGGLVRAYGTAAQEALELASITTKQLMVAGNIEASIATGERIRGQILDQGGSITSAEYSARMTLSFLVPRSYRASLEAYCTEHGIALTFIP